MITTFFEKVSTHYLGLRSHHILGTGQSLSNDVGSWQPYGVQSQYHIINLSMFSPLYRARI